MKTMTLFRPGAVSALGDFDRFFNFIFDDSTFAPATRVFRHQPAVDVRETENAYLLDMELPGFSKKDIDVHVDGSTLSIASQHEEAKEEKGGEDTWIIKERRVSSFSRSFKLPDNANPEDITAEFKNGILSMEVKKRAEAQKRAVEIKTA